MTLSKIGKSHPHVAYCAYVHGLANKWTYFLRTIPNISDLLQPLEDAIFHHFIPALVGKPVSDLERALFALPVRLGGLGICNPQALSLLRPLRLPGHWLSAFSVNGVRTLLISLFISVRPRLRLLL